MNLICGEPVGFRRGKHSAALLHNSNEDVRMVVRGDDVVCLSDDDGLNHIDTLTLDLGDSDAKSLLLLNRVFGVWDRSNWAVLGH